MKDKADIRSYNINDLLSSIHDQNFRMRLFNVSPDRKGKPQLTRVETDQIADQTPSGKLGFLSNMSFNTSFTF